MKDEHIKIIQCTYDNIKLHLEEYEKKIDILLTDSNFNCKVLTRLIDECDVFRSNLQLIKFMIYELGIYEHFKF